MAQNFNNLKVYQETFVLCKDFFNSLKDIEGQFRLKDQLLGSVTSICTNIAEMSAYDYPKQIAQKIKTAVGEANECEFWLDFCKEVDLIDSPKHKAFLERIQKIRKMLYNLLKTIKTQNLKRD
jgi:four helix bundle protein